MFDYHPEKGRVTDDSTGQTDSWQNRPVDGLARLVSSSPVLSQRTHIKFWVQFGLVTECLCISRSTSSGSLFSIPPAGDILYAVVPAYRERREGDGWVKARHGRSPRPEHSATTSVSERSERRCAEHTRPRSIVCLSREVSVSEHRSTGGVSA